MCPRNAPPCSTSNTRRSKNGSPNGRIRVSFNRPPQCPSFGCRPVGRDGRHLSPLISGSHILIASHSGIFLGVPASTRSRYLRQATCRWSLQLLIHQLRMVILPFGTLHRRSLPSSKYFAPRSSGCPASSSSPLGTAPSWYLPLCCSPQGKLMSPADVGCFLSEKKVVQLHSEIIFVNTRGNRVWLRTGLFIETHAEKHRLASNVWVRGLPIDSARRQRRTGAIVTHKS